MEFKKWKTCHKYDFGICKWWCAVNKSKPFKSLDITQSPKQLSFEDTNCLDDYKSEWNNIIQKVKNFFEWKNKEIIEDIISNINFAISLQNFERAQELKEMYNSINERTQKQQIVLQKPISWIFVHIKKIGQFYVFCIIKFVDWKIMDVIRGKEYVFDVDFEYIIIGIQNEFDLNLQKHNDNFFYNFDKKLSIENLDICINISTKSIDSMIVYDSLGENSIMNDILLNLQKKYNLKNYPYNIACVDISHFGWEDNSGAWVEFRWWVPNPKSYRRYKLEKNKSDYDCIYEIICKKFLFDWNQNKDNWNIVDLVVIDWWVWQLNILKKIMTDYPRFADTFAMIDFVSLGKWEARQKSKIWNKSNKNNNKISETLYYFGSNFQVLSKQFDYDDADRLLVKIRDQSHRFSNSYRKTQMVQIYKNNKK